MATTSFANRRAKGDLATKWLLEPFMSHAVAGWRNWQAAHVDSGGWVLATDISTFYDSVAHDHVLESLRDHAGLIEGSAIHQLLERSLQPTLRYLQHHSPEWVEKQGPVHQGLSTGCASDAILANVLLMDLDDVRQRHPRVAYGRYADDILAYGTWNDLVLFIRDISQLLASKSLNLSKGKTQLVESAAAKAVIDARLVSLSEVGEAEVEYEASTGNPPASEFECPTDPNFATPTNLEAILEGKPRDFCKFMSYVSPTGARALPLGHRSEQHVAALALVIEHATNVAKHAVWLLVETVVSPHVKAEAKSQSRATLLGLLKDEVVHPYAKQRILHHLLRPRDLKAKEVERWVFQHFSNDDRETLLALAPTLAISDDLAVRVASRYLTKILNVPPMLPVQKV